MRRLRSHLRVFLDPAFGDPLRFWVLWFWQRRENSPPAGKQTWGRGLWAPIKCTRREKCRQPRTPPECPETHHLLGCALPAAGTTPLTEAIVFQKQGKQASSFPCSVRGAPHHPEHWPISSSLGGAKGPFPAIFFSSQLLGWWAGQGAHSELSQGRRQVSCELLANLWRRWSCASVSHRAPRPRVPAFHTPVPVGGPWTTDVPQGRLSILPLAKTPWDPADTLISLAEGTVPYAIPWGMISLSLVMGHFYFRENKFAGIFLWAAG